MEFVKLGLGKKQKYFPLEKVVITFSENGTYQIQSDLIFDPPQYDKKTLYHILNSNNAILQKIEANISLNVSEKADLKYMPDTYLICFLNGFEEAKQQMERAQRLLKRYDKSSYQKLKEAQRILRKVKYN